MRFAVDVKTGQVVSMDVSSERVGDGRRLKRLVKRAQGSVRVRRVLGDGAYDSKANLNFLAREGIRPVIRVAKNSVARSNGSYARKKAVIEQQAFRPKGGRRYTSSGTGGGSRGRSRSSNASSGSTSQPGSSSTWRGRWR